MPAGGGEWRRQFGERVRYRDEGGTIELAQLPALQCHFPIRSESDITWFGLGFGKGKDLCGGLSGGANFG